MNKQSPTIVTELQDTQRCYNLHEKSANGHIMSILENNFITINFVISILITLKNILFLHSGKNEYFVIALSDLSVYTKIRNTIYDCNSNTRFVNHD